MAVGNRGHTSYTLPSGQTISWGSWAALDAATGKVLWSYASGGSVIDGPAIVDGVVYWGSGYARIGGTGNNKVYAFTVARAAAQAEDR